MCAAVPGKVTVGICDAKVHAFRPVMSWTEVKTMFKGGGGTDFNPLFEEAMKQKEKPDVVIVLTDGYASLPSTPPKTNVALPSSSSLKSRLPRDSEITRQSPDGLTATP